MAFVDEVSLLRQLYPTATVILTWVCTRCHRGWSLAQQRTWPTCPRCHDSLEYRGAHAVIPLRRPHVQQDPPAR